MSLAGLPALPAYVPSPTPLDLTDSLGAIVIGAFIAQTLTGISIYQVYYYYQHFRNDAFGMQCLVYGASLINLLHSILLPKCVYFWVSTYWGNLSALDFVDWSYNVNLALNGIIATVVQLFFAWRVYVLGKRTIKMWGAAIAALIVFISIFQLGWALASTGMAFKLVRQSNFGEFTYGVWAWQLGAAAADIVITISLVGLLRSNKTAFKRTQGVIDRLVILTIETNMLTAILALIVAVQFGTIRNGWPNGINFICVRLYHISLMVNVNSRHDLMEQLAGSRSFQMTPSPNGLAAAARKPYGVAAPRVAAAALQDSGYGGRKGNNPIQVTVTTQHERDGNASMQDLDGTDPAKVIDESESEYEKYDRATSV